MLNISIYLTFSWQVKTVEYKILPVKKTIISLKKFIGLSSFSIFSFDHSQTRTHNIIVNTFCLHTYIYICKCANTFLYMCNKHLHLSNTRSQKGTVFLFFFFLFNTLNWNCIFQKVIKRDRKTSIISVQSKHYRGRFIETLSGFSLSFFSLINSNSHQWVSISYRASLWHLP